MPGQQAFASTTMLVSVVSDEMVEGLVVCALGHRWRVARLADNPVEGLR